MAQAQNLYNAVQEVAVGVSAGTLVLSNGATIAAQHDADGTALTFQGTIPVSETFDATAGTTVYAPDDTCISAA
ncbi:hypothetical protein [Roseofilum sp. Belize Diploria]|uniref:hypothetical protein n=1 Tax=Roseofilum sp. Belize Diploria TaxID=2821501 RepID=UPI001B081B8B|nr:hypothetical protein [Roseofilum sp. Belize Diploria]MBP0011477.1 hypothetical protein [Roseofilum sp. Belize Diploria]